MVSFVPRFPPVPSIDEIYKSLINRYEEVGSTRIGFNDLHLRTKEASASYSDTALWLESRMYQPRQDVTGFLLNFPIHWDINPYNDRNWCLHLNSLRILDRFYNNYDKKKDSEFLDFPFKVIKSWSKYHLSPIFYQTSQEHFKKRHFFMFDDMTCGIRQLRTAYFVDKYMAGLYNIENSDLKYLASIIHFHWTTLAAPENFKSTNHTISLLHALMSLLITTNIEKELYTRWKYTLCSCFDHLVESQFDSKGLHIENSPEYHFFVLRMFNELKESGWYEDANPNTKKILESAQNISKWLKFPDGRVIPIGDSNAKPSAIGKTDLLKAYDQLKEEEVEVFIHSLYCFVEKKYSVDSWSYLAIKSGHMIETHRHKDDLSYLWSESGIDIVVDAGKYAYIKDKYRTYIKSAKAHNTLSFKKHYTSKGVKKEKEYDFIADNSLPHYKKTSYGISLKFEKKLENSEITLIRNIYFCPGSWLVISNSIIGSDDSIEYKDYVHFSPEYIWSTSSYIDRNYYLSNKSGDIYVNIASKDYLNTAISEGGESKTMINGFVSRGYKKLEAAPYIELNGNGNNEFAVGISLLNNNTALNYKDNKLSWIVDGIEYLK